MREIFLAARAAFFVLLLPGTVAGYIPFRNTQHRGPAACSRTKPFLCRCQHPRHRRYGRPAPVRLGLLRHGQGHSRPIDPPRGVRRIRCLPLHPKSHVPGRSRPHPGEAWLFGSSRSQVRASRCSSSSTYSSSSTRSLSSSHSSGSRIGHTGGQCRAGASPRGHFRREHREHRLTCRCS